jgi:hypothetical protein
MRRSRLSRRLEGTLPIGARLERIEPFSGLPEDALEGEAASSISLEDGDSIIDQRPFIPARRKEPKMKISGNKMRFKN